MNTLPAIIVDKLAQFGLIRLPDKAPIRVAESQRSQRPQGKVIGGGTYDPDKEFIDAANQPPKLFDFNSDVDHLGRKIAGYSAQLYETDGKSYKLTRVNGDKTKILEAMERANSRFTEAFVEQLEPAHKLRESKVYSREKHLQLAVERVLNECMYALQSGHTFIETITKLRESALQEDNFAYGYSGGDDTRFGKSWYTHDNYGDGRDTNSEYTPLLGGPWNKQLYLAQYLDMHAKAFEAYNHNPLAHQLIRLATMFTLGRGIDHTSTNVEIDELIREFVDRTEFYDRLQNMATDLWWAGELFVDYYDNVPKRGLTDFRTMDPSTVWEIITQPDDFRNVYYLHQQYSTPYTNYIQSDKKQIPAIMYIIRQVPADQFYHIKINSSEYEKRGRSELFCVLGWLKRLKDLMNARVIKGQLEAAFVWDIEVATGDADVQTAGVQLPDPYNPGATFIHNKSLKLTPQSSNLHSSSSESGSPDVTELKVLIATGMSTPKEFVGETSRGGARSGALASTEPGTKNFETKQQIEMRIVYTVFDRVIQNAVDAGLIDLDDVLQDARTVKRLAVTEGDLENRDNVQQEYEQNKDEAEQQQQDQQQQQLAAAQGANASAAPMVNVKPQQAALGGSKDIAPSANGSTNGKPAAPPQMVNVNKAKARETLVQNNKEKTKLNEAQKRRIKAIKASGKYARELLELSFPSIAQEDRSAKLKDLALVEAMEWLPKSIVATMAAKELDITTYDFQEMWAMIVQEAKDGMSIAHVFGQDNKHVPAVAIAQSVQEEDEAMTPVPPQSQFTNVPVPPVVAGMKQVPAAPPGGGGGPPPGQKPNSGDSKVNNQAAPTPPDPTAKSHGYSDAAKSPFTSEGRSQKEVAQMRAQIYGVLLKEALGPLIDMKTQLARYVLSNQDAVKKLEEAVAVVVESN